jgi:hypothetical protein
VPFSTEPLFAAPSPSPWLTPPPFDVETEAFGNVYPFYAEYMSNVMQESYNRAFDYLDDPQELEPPRKLAPVRVSHPAAAPNFLYDPPSNMGYVTIKTSTDRELFKGWLHQIVSADLRIPERAIFRGEASGFPVWLPRAPRVLPGIVYFSGGDIAIDRELALDSGGILAAEGSITVAAPITVAPSGKPLTLVSLNGSIRVATGGPLQASLVALAGTVTREPGAPPLRVNGSVIARKLSLAELCEGAEPGKIIYDQRADPTAPGAEARIYSVQLSPWRTEYMPPVD